MTEDLGAAEAARPATGRAPPAADGEPLSVRVRLFGIFRELAGEGEREASLPAGATAADLVAALRGSGGLDFLPERPAVAVNREYVDLERPLSSGDEVALIPPVSGGWG